VPRSDNIVGNSDSYLQAKGLLKEQSGGPPTLKTCNVMARTARESPNRQGNSALSDGQTEFRGCNQRNSERDPREESAGVGIIGLLQQAPRSRRVWRFFEPRYRRGSRLRPGGAGLDFLQLSCTVSPLLSFNDAVPSAPSSVLNMCTLRTHAAF
jgi:hypothetical protein